MLGETRFFPEKFEKKRNFCCSKSVKLWKVCPKWIFPIDTPLWKLAWLERSSIEKKDGIELIFGFFAFYRGNFEKWLNEKNAIFGNMIFFNFLKNHQMGLATKSVFCLKYRENFVTFLDGLKIMNYKKILQILAVILQLLQLAVTPILVENHDFSKISISTFQKPIFSER